MTGKFKHIKTSADDFARREEGRGMDKEPIKVLDKGFVRLVDTMGDEDAIVDSARVSYSNHGKRKPSRGLIRRLMRHGHTSPFEMAEIKFHVKVPIFIWRQWIRHRTANVNEVSGRYTELKTEFHMPQYRTSVSHDGNKQGSGDIISHDELKPMVDETNWLYGHAEATYDKLLHGQCSSDDGNGGLGGWASREQARAVLPLSTYTEAYWKIDLHNLLNFLRLRMHPDAQSEIREYAEAMGVVVKKWVPEVWHAFLDYVIHAVKLTRPELIYLASGMKTDNLSKGELHELKEKLEKFRDEYGLEIINKSGDS